MIINIINVWQLNEDSGACEGDPELLQNLSRGFRSVASPGRRKKKDGR